ncbi:kinase suppressor of Ras 2 isoform X3 [Zophobas morio]|uniref:kinase suppressor of Ras 2 isoform X3 n=1 Tax=Zophobas morio TaxID=2755281 RepID=UPI003082F937
MADADATEQERKELHIIQSMIDVSAQRLEGLRTQCATSAELTQQEIRTLEGKLIKLFSNQLVTKLKVHDKDVEHIPSLRQWLQVVGLNAASIQSICDRIATIEELQEKSEHELRMILNEHAPPEELNRLCRALHNLKRYTDVLKKGENENSDMNLYWDSWDRGEKQQTMKTLAAPAAPVAAPVPPVGGLSPRTGRSRAARASVPSEESLSVFNSRGGMKFPTTPPPRRKHLTGIQSAALLADSFPLTKSKSHESQLAKGDNGEIVNSEKPSGKRSRLPTEPGPDTDSPSPILTSPIKSPPYNAGTDSDDNSYKSATSLQVPKSPRTPTPVVRNMTHQINHRFTKTFKMMATCGYCQKQIYFGTGLKCKECKYTCHRDCEERVTPSCGLPPEFLDEFKKKLSCDGQFFSSPIMGKASNTKNIINFNRRKKSHPQPSINIPQFPPPDSSSNTSSCNSSTPSSPAVQSIPTPHASQKQQQFHFPGTTRLVDAVTNLLADLSQSEPNDFTVETHPVNAHHHDVVVAHLPANRTPSASGASTDSERTPVRVDSQESQVSDTETVTDGHRWPRQNSMSMREWDIPYEELRMGDVIGTGRFGTVYRGYWHGDVAVKVLNMSHLNDEKALEQFKSEVSMFRKTRHENVILFMGACMQPPKLAIVTSLSKGMTLYTHLHLRKDKFNMNKTTVVAQQISQGMGYLHARGIIHKDLKSKNIFLDNGKVVITDFGLFSVTKLCFGNRKNDSLWIPPGWLCYLSPEIIRKLHAHQLHAEELPFSKSSDVYAFGTVWYELLCSEWPFKTQPPEAIIWQVGKGMKQPLANLQASRDVKDILMLCWSFREEDRPDFVRLANFFDKLPKKRLARSPSHPIHLSRSAESVF